MAGLTQKRLARRLAGALLAFSAWVLVGTGSSNAGCVHDRPTVAHFEGLLNAGAMERLSDEVMAVPKGTSGRIPTCSGPLCSKGPAAPGPSSWAVPIARDSFAWATSVVNPPSLGSSPLPFEPDLLVSLLEASSIFHPPRVSPI
jgi:hypothetical protein